MVLRGGASLETVGLHSNVTACFVSAKQTIGRSKVPFIKRPVLKKERDQQKDIRCTSFQIQLNRANFLQLNAIHIFAGCEQVDITIFVALKLSWGQNIAIRQSVVIARSAPPMPNTVQRVFPASGSCTRMGQAIPNTCAKHASDALEELRYEMR